MSESHLDLIKLILPEFLVDHFEIVRVEQIPTRIDIYLDENKGVPQELKSKGLISHGFHKQSKIKDFPIRGKQVNLYIRRRRWLDKSTNEVVSRNWELTAKGSRMTEEFAAFLKGIG